jgi:hypothetical protein
MIEDAGTASDRSDCIGYAGFLERMNSEDGGVARRVLPREESIRALATLEKPDRRVIEIQRALIDLVDFLDDDRSRFPLDLRGKLPLDKPLTPDHRSRTWRSQTDRLGSRALDLGPSRGATSTRGPREWATRRSHRSPAASSKFTGNAGGLVSGSSWFGRTGGSRSTGKLRRVSTFRAERLGQVVQRNPAFGTVA